MNNKQKEVEAAKLAAEAQELKHLKAIYNKAADDINKKLAISNGKINVLLKDFDELDDVQKSILQSQIYQRDFQLSLKKQIDGFLSDLQTDQYKSIDEYLKGCYETGFLGSMYDLHGQGIPIITPIDQKQVVKAMQLDPKISKNLYTKLGEDVGLLKKRIANNVSRGIATASEYKVIARNIAADSNVGFNRAMRITRTEGHRVQVQAAVDVQHKAKEKGADVLKQWSAALDGRTRESHARVDGEIRELDEKFSNGLKYPGDSAGGAAEVVNCRCALLQRARWALDEEELQTLKDRAAFFNLDKTENFEDFKEKYIAAADETANNTKFKIFSSGEEANIYFGKRPDRALRKSNLEEYDNKLEKYRQSPFGKWYEDLSSEESSAISAYSGDDYSGINGLLRKEMTKKMVDAWNNSSSTTIQDKIKNITMAIDKFEIKEPIKVFRTCEEDVFYKLKKEIGSTFIDDGFTSTSILQEKVASGNVRMEIDVPAGKGIGAWINPLSGAEDEEWEFLLQRGTKYRIDGIETSNGETRIKMTVVGNERHDWEYATREEVKARWKRLGIWDEESEKQI